MKCQNCGSLDVEWRYERGELVCRNCGLIIDIIMEKPLNKIENNSFILWRSYRRYIKNKERSYEKFSKLRSKIKNRDDLFIDPCVFTDYLLHSHVKGRRIYKSLRNQKALQTLQDNQELKSIIEKIVSKDPVLASRTVRGKIAIAYTLLLLQKGLKPKPREISEKTGVSMTQARRIALLVDRICSGLNNKQE